MDEHQRQAFYLLHVLSNTDYSFVFNTSFIFVTVYQVSVPIKCSGYTEKIVSDVGMLAQGCAVKRNVASDPTYITHIHHTLIQLCTY